MGEVTYRAEPRITIDDARRLLDHAIEAVWSDKEAALWYAVAAEATARAIGEIELTHTAAEFARVLLDRR